MERVPGRSGIRRPAAPRAGHPTRPRGLWARKVGDRRLHDPGNGVRLGRRRGQHGRVPGDPPPLDRRHDGRWLDLRVLRAARRLGDPGRDVRRRPRHLRFGPALEDGPHARHEHVLRRGVPGQGARAVRVVRGATCWPAPTPWRPVATCTSTGRRPSSSRRSPSASGSTPASTPRRSTATRSPSRTCSPHA